MAEQWYRSIPPITRAYATACVVTTLAAHLDVIGPLALYLNVYSIYYQWEVGGSASHAYAAASFGCVAAADAARHGDL